MGLYNILFGRHPHADLVLAMLGLTRDDVGRFRDVFVSGGEIAVYTRNGGGNREEYDAVFEFLSQHPNYLRDEDDSFDSTYATIFFSFPDEFADTLRILDNGETWNPDELWLDKLAEFQSLGREEIEARFPDLVQLVRQVKEAMQ